MYYVKTFAVKEELLDARLAKWFASFKNATIVNVTMLSSVEILVIVQDDTQYLSKDDSIDALDSPADEL